MEQISLNLENKDDSVNELINGKVDELINGKVDELIINRILDEDHICSICMEIMAKPVMINTSDSLCGHKFCSECINELYSITNVCPLCKHVFDLSMLVHDLGMTRKISTYRLKCMYQKSGCTWTGEYGEDGKSFNAHIDSCTYRPICRQCSQPMSRLHGDVCSKKKIVCRYSSNGCGEEVIRDQLDAHLLICPRRPMKCNFAQHGVAECVAVAYYDQWANHQITCADIHASIVDKVKTAYDKAISSYDESKSRYDNAYSKCEAVIKESSETKFELEKLKKRFREAEDEKKKWDVHTSKFGVAINSEYKVNHRDDIYTFSVERYRDNHLHLKIRVVKNNNIPIVYTAYYLDKKTNKYNKINTDMVLSGDKYQYGIYIPRNLVDKSVYFLVHFQRHGDVPKVVPELIATATTPYVATSPSYTPISPSYNPTSPSYEYKSCKKVKEI